MTEHPDRARGGAWLRRALAGVAPSRAAAQEARADTAAVLLRVAEQLEAEGRTALAAALLQTILERYGETPAAEAARRRAAERAAAAEVTGSGRGELMVWGTLYGLWLGAAIPAAAGTEEPEAYGVGLLLGGPAGFLASRLVAGQGLTEGQARAITFGGTWGTWQGFGWREVLDIGSNTSESTFRAMVLGGLAGVGVGAVLANNSSITPGTATAVNFGALWGTWYGFALAMASGIDDGDKRLTASLIGGNVGLVATALTAPGWNLSRQRARLINVAGVAGLVGGYGLLLLLQPENDNTAILVPTATSAAGLLAGAMWTRNHDRRSGPAGGSGGEALLERHEGRWAVGEPRPVPVMLEAAHGRRVPGLGLALVSLRF